MKALILVSLALAGTIHLIDRNQDVARDYLCASYLASDNPRVHWPLCDPFWKALAAYDAMEESGGYADD